MNDTTTFQAIYKCNRCKTVTKTEIAARFVRKDHYNGVTRYFVHPRNCTCGAEVGGKVISGLQDNEVSCGTRCTVATNADCRCSCGGKHHGDAYKNFFAA